MTTGRRPGPSSALFTDAYELTMLTAALRAGTGARRCTFEVFARSLPPGRRYGVVAGTGRLLTLVSEFSFDDDQLDSLSDQIDGPTREWLRGYRFGGDIEGYPEGELYFPGSPILSISGNFAECVVLETLVLSVLNHDSAIASAAARMVSAAGGRTLIEMGSRRTHEEAAVAAARAAYLAGFTATSNLESGRRHGVPTSGTSAHSFTLLHTSADGPDEEAAFRSQVDALGVGTTLLVDTYDITRGIETAVKVAGTELGGVRIDSGDLGVLAAQAREQLDALGATGTRVILSGDLDEYSIAALRAEPVDGYGVGTSVVTGSGEPTAGMVYKLVEVDGMPVAKRSSHKETRAGAKGAVRRARGSGTVTEEVVHTLDERPEPGPHDRDLTAMFVEGGTPRTDLPNLDDSRAHLAHALTTLPWEGLTLSRGEPAIPTTFLTRRESP